MNLHRIGTAVASLAFWWVMMLSSPAVRADYAALVAEDKPVAYWRFENGEMSATSSNAGRVFEGKAQGPVATKKPGPRADAYPDFDKANHAVDFTGKPAMIKIADPSKNGADSVFDFRKSDTITIEAWVNPRSIVEGQQVYIIGKGRTTNEGFAANNQNWALRLRGTDGGAGVSFLFRNANNGKGKADSGVDWHRWTSRGKIMPAPGSTGWHHVAVTYTFGDGDSIRGYIDGEPVPGSWDMGGKTNDAPVVDDDEVWIGSSMGGNPSSTFNGSIDEIALYRKALDPKRIAARFKYEGPTRVVDAYDPDAAKDAPADRVSVAIIENVPDSRNWVFAPEAAAQQYDADAFAFVGLPRKYSQQAVAVDRSNPFMVRAMAKVRIAEAGEHRVLLRSKNAARLFIDDKLVAQTKFISPNGSGHEQVPDLPAASEPWLHPMPAGHQERLITMKLDAGEHVFVVDAMIGGKRMRPELGELLVAIAPPDERLRIVTPGAKDGLGFELSEHEWQQFAREARGDITELNACFRREADQQESEYWQKRHTIARAELAERMPPMAPVVSPEAPVNNAIDQYIAARILEAGAKLPTDKDLADDLAFVRRVYLDTVGVIPTREEIAAFLADNSPDRRARLIDRLLNDPRWADHWVGYWQDVLAENPGLLKPKLNNTGPFRFWIYESFLDNKPMDRFATELVSMQGSTYGGGPAGFAMASQNDLPMAAKAHIIGQAFLAVDMTCARCHDAPHHPIDQKHLFNLAAMLDRKPVKVPKSSVVNRPPDELRKMIISVSLKPGESIQPDWPFTELAPAEIPAGVLRDENDPRQRFAAILTSPHNERFSKVIVNRLWARYMGFGIVEPVDDWVDAKPSHPMLLDYLAHELANNGYDLKHVARLILNSHAYQRRVGVSAEKPPKYDERLFALQTRRRMSAEQVVDSLFVAAGKPMRSEMLTLDPEGRRPQQDFLNFGAPRRAWQFVGLANERDRPALALPMAQSVIDVLATFGWRESRQNPISERDESPTVLQPLMIANGSVAHRMAQLSDDSTLTELALRDQPVEKLVDALFMQVLSRAPSKEERAAVAELLRDGYAERVVPGAPIVHREPMRNAVSWANHLNAEASKIKLQLEEAARRGDPPTQRLKADWRVRMEDAVWALLNSPEFLFVP